MDMELDEEHHAKTGREDSTPKDAGAVAQRRRAELKRLLATPVDGGHAIKLVMPATKKERAKLQKLAQGHDRGAALRAARK